MAKKSASVEVDLPYAVHVGKNVYGPGDGVEIPEEAARQMHARHFPDGKHPFAKEPRHSAPAQREPGTPPPKSGAGSGVDEWKAYAGQVDVDIPDDVTTRDAVIEAIAAAGKPVDPQ